jgi:hypothetical protein
VNLNLLAKFSIALFYALGRQHRGAWREEWGETTAKGLFLSIAGGGSAELKINARCSSGW